MLNTQEFIPVYTGQYGNIWRFTVHLGTGSEMVSVLVLLFLQTQLVLMEHRLLDSTVTRHCLLKIECNRFLQVKTLKTSNRESLMAAIVGREQPIQLQATIDIDEQMAAFFVDYHNHINAAGFTFFVDNFELTSGFNIFKILIKLRIFCRVVVINKGQHNKLNSVETGALYVVLQSMDNQVLHGLNKNVIRHFALHCRNTLMFVLSGPTLANGL